jgi:predicted 2-oxoglutarate/Fe(II)-dependent dioxygenase YbiX
LHAAELLHLREVLAEQQAAIEEQAARIAELQRDIQWADGRADMFHDMAQALTEAAPGAQIGITQW